MSDPTTPLMACLDAFGEVTLGVYGKPLKPPEVVAVINGLRNEVDEAWAKIDGLQENNSQLRLDVDQLRDRVMAHGGPAIPETRTVYDGGTDGEG